MTGYRIRRALAGVALAFGLSACSPQEVIGVIFAEHSDDAVAVARCESGLDPAAVSPGGGNHGLFQINNVHRRRWESFGWSWGDRYDPILNTAYAKMLFDEQGWRPWPNCP